MPTAVYWRNGPRGLTSYIGTLGHAWPILPHTWTRYPLRRRLRNMQPQKASSLAFLFRHPVPWRQGRHEVRPEDHDGSLMRMCGQYAIIIRIAATSLFLITHQNVQDGPSRATIVISDGSFGDGIQSMQSSRHWKWSRMGCAKCSDSPVKHVSNFGPTHTRTAGDLKATALRVRAAFDISIFKGARMRSPSTGCASAAKMAGFASYRRDWLHRRHNSEDSCPKHL